jgi:hypothetical protein
MLINYAPSIDAVFRFEWNINSDVRLMLNALWLRVRKFE